MVKCIEVELLLRNFLGCYDSPCAIPIKFPASLSQITPLQYPCERRGLKKHPHYEDIYSSKVTPAFLTSALSRCIHVVHFWKDLDLPLLAECHCIPTPV